MAKHFQSIRGMHDILPAYSPAWQQLETALRNILQSYGYREIRTPIVEKTELFKRSIGEVTDIVEKEMYTFADRNGDSLTLRPEGTASCVRAGIEHGLLHNQQQRLWYQGPMFRHERPQKGRYRQFHQIGVETYGIAGAEIDAELIAMTARFWNHLGIENVKLELNTLGSSESRQQYRDVLVDYFSGHRQLLDEDSLRRLETNPLRILDSKNPDLTEVISAAPVLLDSLDAESKEHFACLTELLDEMSIVYTVNPRLVRGLDYYTKTVFEWITTALGAQGTICAGGRYDGLVGQLGGRETPAAGFALGVERLLELIHPDGLDSVKQKLDVYFLTMGDGTLRAAMQLTERLRDALPDLRIMLNAGGGGFKAQMKRADKSLARYALILGEDELQAGQVSLKDLRDAAQGQQLLTFDEIVDYLNRHLK